MKIAALQCLVEVMHEYYKFMGDYMAAALFGITMDAMGSESDEDKVALQGIEFWSTVCDKELDLGANEDGVRLQAPRRNPPKPSVQRSVSVGARC